jgi:hypothetical protein
MMIVTAAGTSLRLTRGCDRLLIDSARRLIGMLAPIEAQTSTVVHAMHSVTSSVTFRKHRRRSDGRAKSSLARMWLCWAARRSPSSQVQWVQLSEAQAEA